MRESQIAYDQIAILRRHMNDFAPFCRFVALRIFVLLITALVVYTFIIALP